MFPVGNIPLPVHKRWNCVMQRALSGPTEIRAGAHQYDPVRNCRLCTVADPGNVSP